MDLVFLLLLIAVGVLFQVLFWGGLIALAIKLFKAGGGATSVPYSQLPWSNLPGTRSGPYEPGPVESQVGFMAASEGIDLNR